MDNHSHSEHNITGNIKIAFLLNLTFTIIEIIGGFLTNSVAIISDAVHDLGDSLALGLSLYLEKLSNKKRDKRFTFGYRRFSLLAALINSIILIVGSIIILSEAIPRLFKPEMVNAKGMLVLAIFGIIVNGAAALRVKSGKSLNERVITWHFLEDILGWAAVLIISVVMLFWNIPILDPILSILITLFIFWNIFKRLKETILIFLQAIPNSIDISEIENSILTISSVLSIHDTHVWTMDGQYIIMSSHIVIKNNLTESETIVLKKDVKDLCRINGVNHVTIELETENEVCSQENC